MQANPMSTDQLPPLNLAQSEFSSALLKAERPVPQDVVGPTKEKQAQKRFGVYRNNVLVSLTEAMIAAFPTVHQLVGDEYFRAMAKVFITENPPTSAMLSVYGATFGAFLDMFEPVQALPYLGDVARLELLWLKAYHAADQAPLDPTSLGEVPQELLGSLTFDMHPSLQLLSAEHAAHSIWAAHKSDNPAATMAALQNTPEDILITRPQWDVMAILLPAGGHAFIAALAEGKTLEVAATMGAQDNEHFDFAQNLGGLLETGALTAFHLPQKE